MNRLWIQTCSLTPLGFLITEIRILMWIRLVIYKKRPLQEVIWDFFDLGFTYYPKKTFKLQPVF
jgi:hypothetical protein